jgi:sugar O-acyltransferase (sialic acid O-acetyltransferase NeuD family)
MKTIAIVGAGGNAREIAAIIRDIGGYDFICYLADTIGRYDSPMLGGFDWLTNNVVNCLAMGIGSPQAKLSVGRRLAAEYPDIEWPVLIHPTAYVGPTCELQRGVIVCVKAITTENIKIGEFAQLNFGCMVGHEAIIGDGCLINPGASISGGVEIGEETMVGAGACILQYRTIGRNSIVGAGAVVIHDVACSTTVVGVPAKATHTLPAQT